MQSMQLLTPFAKRRAARYGIGLWIGLLAGTVWAQEATLIVTVFDERTGETVTGLGREQFAVKDGDTPLRVASISEPRGPVDVLLLVDASLAGEAVRPIAEALVEELGESEAMAIVAYDEGADLLQDFTAEKRYLRSALNRVEYGGLPRAHDALFAAVDGGFEASLNRKAVVLLSNGVIARSRVTDAEVLDIARAKRVSVYPVFVRANARSLFRRLALRTGGASFAARRLKLAPRSLARRVFEAVRSPYELAVTGVYTLGDRLEATIRPPAGGKSKVSASVLPVD